MAGNGFAVVDVETTGFSPPRGDRIVELAVVHLSPAGEIEGAWETLVNPMRDVGATHVHGITASDVAYAPPMAAIMPRVLNLLSDRVLVAHNLAFDTRFLFAEFANGMGADFDGSAQFSSICTMQLASTFFPGSARSLDACCAQASISREASHRAIADARDTGRLLAHYLTRSRSDPYWDERLSSTRHWWFDDTATPAWVPRESADVLPRPHFLDRLVTAAGLPRPPGAELDYLGLLDRALLDGYLSSMEQDDLVDAAHALGLSRDDVGKLHDEYFDRMSSIAWADGELTDDEAEELLAIAAALRLDSRRVNDALAAGALDAEPDTATVERFVLRPGQTVVLTGDMRHARSAWEARLASQGYLTAGTVSKKVALVAAADPETRSGKAKRARELGIPVVSEAKLADLVGWPS